MNQKSGAIKIINYEPFQDCNILSIFKITNSFYFFNPEDLAKVRSLDDVEVTATRYLAAA